MECRCMRDNVAGRFVAHSSDKAAAFHNNIYSSGQNEHNTTHESVNVDFLVLIEDSLTQIQTDAATKGIKTSSFECLSMIDVFIASKANGTTDALAVFIEWNGALEPLAVVVAETEDDEFGADVKQNGNTKIFGPGMLPQPIKMYDTLHAEQLQQGCHNKNDSDNSPSCHFICILVNNQICHFPYNRMCRFEKRPTLVDGKVIVCTKKLQIIGIFCNHI